MKMITALLAVMLLPGAASTPVETARMNFMDESAIAAQLIDDFAEEQGGKNNPLLAEHYRSDGIFAFSDDDHRAKIFEFIDRNSLRYSVDISRLTVLAWGRIILPGFQGMESAHSFTIARTDILRAVATRPGLLPDWVTPGSPLANLLCEMLKDKPLTAFVTRATVERDNDTIYLVLRLKNKHPRIQCSGFNNPHERSFTGEYTAIGKQASSFLENYRREFEAVMRANGFNSENPSPAFTVRHELLPAIDQTGTIRKISPSTVLQSWRTNSRITLYENFKMTFTDMPSAVGMKADAQQTKEYSARYCGSAAADMLMKYFVRTKFSLIDE